MTSLSKESSAVKRMRAEPDATRFLTTQDRSVLSVIKQKENIGILKASIKRETNLNDREINKALKNLGDHNLIKEVANHKSKKNQYMAVEYKPSEEIDGGSWYENGHLDTTVIQTLKHACRSLTKRPATLDAIYERVKTLIYGLTKQQVSEILNLMVLSNEVIEVKSTGFGEYHTVPIGTICYKVTTATVGAMASIPCGSCPRISKCTPDGLVSPSTCVYFTKWLDISF